MIRLVLVNGFTVTVGVLLFIPKYRHWGGLGFCVLMLAFLPLHIWDLFKEQPAVGHADPPAGTADVVGDGHRDHVRARRASFADFRDEHDDGLNVATRRETHTVEAPSQAKLRLRRPLRRARQTSSVLRRERQ